MGHGNANGSGDPTGGKWQMACRGRKQSEGLQMTDGPSGLGGVGGIGRSRRVGVEFERFRFAFMGAMKGEGLVLLPCDFQ
jgi:hypothetical protein